MFKKADGWPVSVPHATDQTGLLGLPHA